MVPEVAEPRSYKELCRDWFHKVTENHVVSLAFSEFGRSGEDQSRG